MARSKYEILCDKELTKDGWTTDYKVRAPYPIRNWSVDFFGLFDILAYKDGALRFISVKGTAGPSTKHQEAIRAFKVPDGISLEIWKFDREPKDKRKIRRRVTKLN